MNWLFRMLGISQDQLREVRINNYRQQMLDAKSPAEAMTFWRLMSKEIRERTPEQVARMEKEQGLA